MNFQKKDYESCGIVESDSVYRNLIESAPVAIFVHKDGRFLYVNKEAARLYGLSDASDLVNQPLSKFFHQSDLHLFQQCQTKPTDFHKEKSRGNLRLVRADDRVFDLEMISVPIIFDDQKAGLSVCIDITEQKRGESCILNHIMFLETLIDTIPNPIFYKDTDGAYLGCNSIFAQKILGLPRGEIIGKTVFDLPELIPREYADKYSEQDQKLFQQQGVQIYESKVRCADTIIRDFVFYKACYRNAQNALAGLVGIMIDVTELKKAEKNLHRYQEQLRDLTNTMALVEEFERHRIATSLQEQIGQTLAVSNMKLGALRAELATPEGLKVLDEVRELINQSIHETRALTFELSPPVLHEVGLKAALEWLVEKFEKQGDISYTYHDDGKTTELNDNIRVMLFRDTRELLFNVAFHSRATKAAVKLWEDDDYIYICVKDNGVGFDLTKIDSAITEPSGFGIFSIQERMHHLGGRFEIKSTLGEGTQVTIVSPKVYYRK